MIAAVFPDAPSEETADGLELGGVTLVPVTDLVPEAVGIVDADVLVVELDTQPMRRLRDLGRVIEAVGLPVLVVVLPENLALIETVSGITDFVLRPVDPVELRMRLRRLTTDVDTDEAIRFKDLEINHLHYRATLAGEPMDLTFVEYELLRFLVQNPVRVWSRSQLLSKVWGYEYYGGARTVDVHIRRLRAKLGGERSSWITTVRSVGYRFG
ncbi:MAG: response regulator transcription factor [Actinobacteria bacterium]|nr:response regulator transcription factor [Actinomycetota bacterium]